MLSPSVYVTYTVDTQSTGHWNGLLIQSVLLLNGVDNCPVLKHVQWPVTWLLEDPISLLDLSKIYYNLLTPRSRVRLEKLTGSQLLKKFSAFYGTRRFITAFTSARHLSISWATSIQSIPSHPITWRSILILSFHLNLGLPSGLFAFGFPTETLYTPVVSLICYMSRPSHSSLLDHPNNICWLVQIIKLLVL